MKKFQVGLILIALIIRFKLVKSQSLNAQLVRRQYHDGYLYEDYAADAPSVRYSITNGVGWENLDMLAEENFLIKKAMFCSIGPGTWLLYPDVNFGTASRKAIKFINGEICAPVDNVNSIQPLGSMHQNNEDQTHALTFSEKFFSSPVHTLKNGTEPPPIKSAIFMGEGMWTINTGDGKEKICVSTIGTVGDVCLLEDVEAAFLTTAVSIEKECDIEGNETESGTEAEPGMEIYGLQTCYASGFREISYDLDLGMEGMQKVCKGDYEEGDHNKDKFYSIMSIWSRRITGKNFFNAVETAEFSGITHFKLNVIPQILNIVSVTCSQADEDYLELLADIFVFIHLKNGDIWDDIPTNSSDYMSWKGVWEQTITFLEICYQTAKETNTEFKTQCTPMAAHEMPDLGNLHVLENFLNGESFDFVIENFYLMFSYASTFCYNLVGTGDNMWGELPLLLKEEFLYPLREQWKSPGKLAHYYPLMFNGFEMDDEKKNLISCLQAVVVETPFYDPLARPEELMMEGNETNFDGMIGKPPGKNKTKASEAGRPKRQWQRYSVESDEGNEVDDGGQLRTETEDSTPSSTRKPVTTIAGTTSRPAAVNLRKQKSKVTTTTSTTTIPPTSTTTIHSTTTTPVSTTIEAVTSTLIPSTTTESGAEGVESTTKKRRKKKAKKGKKGKGNKKRSKLLRKQEGETLEKEKNQGQDKAD